MAKLSFLQDMKEFSGREKCTNAKKMQRVQNYLKQLEVLGSRRMQKGISSQTFEGRHWNSSPYPQIPRDSQE
jgi:hypothetical protein